jgi:serine-type D-Ala-D-Ala carboxypeptidase (penicillin-binding protein 5/6)
MGDDDLKAIATERAARFWRALLVVVIVVGLLLLAVGAGYQWLRPIPRPAFRPATTAVARLPGTKPTLPWPTTGEAAMAVEGIGNFGGVEDSRPVPIAGLADVLAAYVILRDHPLNDDSAGPNLTVDARTLAAYQLGTAAQDAEVKVTQGETLSELDALEGLLVDSGNDMVTLLADWDAGSTAAFVTRMNHAASSLGLQSTHISDPSGLSSSTVSSPVDLVRLGEAAMAIGSFRQIVDLGQATLPVDGLEYNLNFDLGQDGIVGIKTGTDEAANGCYLFASVQSIAGRNVTVVGAVLGQAGASPNTAAVDAGDALLRAALASIRPQPLLPVGHLVGQVVEPWGASAPVVVTASEPVIGWAGLTISYRADVDLRSAPLPAGVALGDLVADQNGRKARVVVRTTGPLSGPSAFWRLTR